MKVTITLILLIIAVLIIANMIVPSGYTFILATILSTFLIGLLVVRILKDDSVDS